MSWVDTIKSWFGGRRKSEPSTSRASMDFPRRFAGGRASIDTRDDIFASALSIVTPLSSETYWRDFNLDSKTFDRISVRKLMELLADLSPDVSKALWDFLRFCNPGHEYFAYKPGTEEVDEQAQAALGAFIGKLHGPYAAPNMVPLDIIIGSMFAAQFLRGAFCAELVLDERGKIPLEIATPDPATITFKRIDDPVRGKVWQIGQWQSGKLVVLDRITIAYVPVDPLPGKPEGRAMAAPALFSTLFLLGMLHDLRRVIAQQGYPRIDIGVALDELMKLMPSDLKGNPAAVKEWVDKAIKAIQDEYAKLEPDDAYFHLDPVVKVNRPVGTLDPESLGSAEGIIKSLERFTVRALKSMPLLFGTTDGVSEANANRQYEIHVAGIKSIQHLCEGVLAHMLTLALRVQGIAADVKFRFAELRAAEMFRDAQTERLKALNAAFAYDRGWLSQDESAQRGAGKEKADAPEPRATTSQSTGNLNNLNAEPGSNRGHRDALPESEITVLEEVGVLEPVN